MKFIVDLVGQDASSFAGVTNAFQKIYSVRILGPTTYSKPCPHGAEIMGLINPPTPSGATH